MIGCLNSILTAYFCISGARLTLAYEPFDVLVDFTSDGLFLYARPSLLFLFYCPAIRLRTPSERRYVLKSRSVTMLPRCFMFVISAYVCFWTISGILIQLSGVISFNSRVKRKNYMRSGPRLPHPARWPYSESRWAYSLSTT